MKGDPINLNNMVPIALLSVLSGLMIVAAFPSDSSGGEVDTKPCWVYFENKGFVDRAEIEAALNRLERSLTPKAKARRMRMQLSRLVDEADLPVSTRYIKEVVGIASVEPRHQSRWLNAISIELTRDQSIEIEQLPFVDRVEPVRRFFRRPVDHEAPDIPQREEHPNRDYQLDYGSSLRQNLFLNAPELHDLGYRGRGVLVGVLDAGFNNLNHNCFQHLDIVAMWDFVNNDEDVGDGDDLGNGSHGTKTLSIMAGLDPEQMIGIAHEASYVLGKTENTEWERPVEEDHWVAGVEWMDELGVEVVNSSLSYMEWYDYEDLDGNTGVTTIAADRAVAVGMVIVVSAGNTGRAEYPLDKMGAPADGDSVFAIGALEIDSACSPYSSRGPTWDGRIKPDFTTLGTSVRWASSRNDDGYGGGAGTSFSAPAISGLCALLIQANPYLNPIALREVLREASNNREEPDTLLGWGIPDGLAALELAELERIELVVPLHSGWNTISHNLNIPILDIRETFEPLVERDNLIMVKDDQGRFYRPDMDFNNIPFWSNKEGYQVNVIDDDELVFDGELCVYTFPMELREGWQIISYLPNFDMSPIQAFQSLVENNSLELVKDEWGRFYTPEFNFNNIPVLQPGRGYHVKLNEDDHLVYPRVRVHNIFRSTAPTPAYFESPDPLSNGMSLLVIAENGIESGDEIGCFGSEGELIGSSIFNGTSCGVALWSDNEGESFELQIRQRSTGLMYYPSAEWIRGENEYHVGELGVVKVSLPSDIIIKGSETPQIIINPNPFNDQLVVRYLQMPEGSFSVNVFNMRGRLVAKRDGEALHSGTGQLIFSTNSWSSGSYLIQIQIDGKVVQCIADHLK